MTTRGLPALAHGRADMNSLMALGTRAAWDYSTVATFLRGLLPKSTCVICFPAGLDVGETAQRLAVYRDAVGPADPDLGQIIRYRSDDGMASRRLDEISEIQNRVLLETGEAARDGNPDTGY